MNQEPAQLIFSHGKESGPNGTKIRALSGIAEKHGLNVRSVDYTDIMDPDQRVQRLLEAAAQQTAPLILVGSSMGAYVSLVAAETLKPAAVFLMAPALYIPGWAVQEYTSDVPQLSIVHGWADEVIPAEHSIRYAQQAHCELHLIDADHRLSACLEQVGDLFEALLRRTLRQG